MLFNVQLTPFQQAAPLRDALSSHLHSRVKPDNQSVDSHETTRKACQHDRIRHWAKCDERGRLKRHELVMKPVYIRDCHRQFRLSNDSSGKSSWKSLFVKLPKCLRRIKLCLFILSHWTEVRDQVMLVIKTSIMVMNRTKNTAHIIATTSHFFE